MNKTRKYKKTEPFVVVGGVGGSGTRLIASILQELGLNIGSNLNGPLDNNVFVYLFRRIQTLDVIKDEKIFKQYLNILRKSFCETKAKLTKKDHQLIDQLSTIKNKGVSYQWLHDQSIKIKKNECPTLIKNKPLSGKWGWKAPNSHIMMKELHQIYPNMKYIMVVRNGLDMAYSDNQGQLSLWGPTLFDHWTNTPKYSLKYWRIVHERILNDSKQMGKHFLWLDYDELCNHPEPNLKRLFDFLEIDYVDVTSMIRPSSGVGRYKEHSIRDFDKEDVEYVKSLGYDTKY